MCVKRNGYSGICIEVEWKANVAGCDHLNLCVVELHVAYQCWENSFRESSLTVISLYVL
jgi:hypothetical protein